MFVCRKAFAFSSHVIRMDPLLIRRIQNNILQDVSAKCTNVDPENPVFKAKYTNDEQEKILNTLNTSDINQLSRFSISRGEIKNLESWRSRKGFFQTLSDLLEVEGLSVDVLEELCDKILSSNKKSLNRNLKNLVVPALTKNQIENINTAIGLRLDPVGLSWAKISQEDNILCEWGFHDFRELPKKVTPVDLFHMAVRILNVIPKGDIYLLEAPPSSQNQKQLNAMPTYTQQLEFTSMLIALINTSDKHNPSCKSINADGEVQHTNKVYYLKHYLPARLFKLLVGKERVSSTDVIKKLLVPERDHSLPCTPISVSEELTKSYFTYATVNRDLMGQALLLTISFMDLCLYKNPKTLNALDTKKKVKYQII